MSIYDYGFVVMPKSIRDIRRQTDRIRAALDFDPTKPFPIVRFMEHILPSIFKNFRFEVCTIKELGDKEGETLPLRQTIRIREDVYLGMCEGIGVHRFTGGHETGHLFMTMDFEPSMARSFTNEHKIYCSSEWQADTFAAELLMPFEECIVLTPEEIKNRYKVSGKAADLRARKIRKEIERKCS